METSSKDALTITGVQIAYYFICQRKLWLFSHQIQMEQNSTLVALGNVLHENSYTSKKKEIQLGPIKIDFYEKNRGRISEVKKTPAMEDAHIWQMKYYLYFLKTLGMHITGQLHYTQLRRTEEVLLSPQDEQKIEQILTEIKQINQAQQPIAPIEETICKKCSYYEICYI